MFGRDDHVVQAGLMKESGELTRGLSNNGTVSGVSGRKIAGLPPLTVRMWVEWFRSGASRCSGEAR